MGATPTPPGLCPVGHGWGLKGAPARVAACGCLAKAQGCGAQDTAGGAPPGGWGVGVALLGSHPQVPFSQPDSAGKRSLALSTARSSVEVGRAAGPPLLLRSGSWAVMALGSRGPCAVHVVRAEEAGREAQSQHPPPRLPCPLCLGRAVASQGSRVSPTTASPEEPRPSHRLAVLQPPPQGGWGSRVAWRPPPLPATFPSGPPGCCLGSSPHPCSPS